MNLTIAGVKRCDSDATSDEHHVRIALQIHGSSVRSFDIDRCGRQGAFIRLSQLFC